MPVNSHTRQIIELAWARILGLPDGAITEATAAGGRRIEVPTDDGGTGGEDEHIATFVRLYGASVLYGPRWLIEAARDVDDEVLSLESTLIRLGAGQSARSLGEAVLYYADDVPEIERSGSVAVSFEAEDARALEAACPADDVAEVGLSGLDATFTLVPDDGSGTRTGEPVAGAGYEEWQGLIGHLGVLVRPDVRRHGLGAYAGAIAMEEAFTEGLVPQWRAGMGHRASQHLADALGFELAGSQTTVLFNQ
ncbi:GNAT family N-acetyltransferase [Citricoccus sp. SGAir0253]|uniref:GNAT family N-acetyltransferase n=1 Tax=Citricoccus sp. SGAir0253 TaxID=2567881 RepID=UPI0010CCE056|nr:GNAT family N-acetyltransferase [Citricoccus sp. SGAir0253]QCU77439.1 GNAT family N-acetyltransferase [Citricoccus sp. SGAir0253]